MNLVQSTCCTPLQNYHIAAILSYATTNKKHVCMYVITSPIIYLYSILITLLDFYNDFFSRFGIEKRKVLLHLLLLKVYDDDANQIFNLIHNLDVTKKPHMFIKL